MCFNRINLVCCHFLEENKGRVKGMHLTFNPFADDSYYCTIYWPSALRCQIEVGLKLEGSQQVATINV